MKRRHARKLRSSVLIVSLLTTAVIGMLLASYLTLVQTQTLSVARSQAWNAAIAIAEGGVEEALAQLNPGVGSRVLNLAANGWEQKADGNYGPQQARYLGPNYYDVVVVPGTNPVIRSTGFTAAPFGFAPISRTVEVTTTNARLFAVGMAAKENIDLKGFNVETDSFDSNDPDHSTNGRYDPAEAKDNGDVASNSGLIDSVNVGNADIKGKLRMGPYGVPILGPNGSVGDADWVNGGTSGIKPGWFIDDFNVDFWEVRPPYSSGWALSGEGTNTYVLKTDNYYRSGDLVLKTGDTMLVTGNAALYVTGEINMQGSSQIIIAPGGSLSLYVGGPGAAFTQIDNQSTARSFSYYGLPTNTSVSFGGNASFIGTVYAPNAAFVLGGGGKDIFDFEGSCMVKTIKMNGHFRFHFDEDLLNNGPFRGYVPTSWREL